MFNNNTKPTIVQFCLHFQRVAVYQYSERTRYSYWPITYPICQSVCRLVCLSVRKMYCGKSAEWIRVPFGLVSGVSWRGRSSFGGEFGETLLHSCAEMREPIELSFAVVSAVGPGIDVLDGVDVLQGEGGFGGLSRSFPPFISMAHRW